MQRLGPTLHKKANNYQERDIDLGQLDIIAFSSLKRELLEGHLSKPSQVVLPGAAAIGGMVVPALIYWFLNKDYPDALDGWAIPMATDIAFALGVLALLGKRVPVSLKLFLMTLAIIDDLGAIIVIAVFYSSELSGVSLLLAAACLIVLIAMNRMGVIKVAPYMIVGLILWVCVLKSGVHATLAGVTLAFCIPLRTKNSETSPLMSIEHALHPWVAYAILPLFAFANAGVSLAGVSMHSFVSHVPMGIAAGLLIGKTLGVFGLTWIAIKTGMAALPAGANWGQVFGVAILCGIGFTMSLFVGSLAFVAGSGAEGVCAGPLARVCRAGTPMAGPGRSDLYLWQFAGDGGGCGSALIDMLGAEAVELLIEQGRYRRDVY